MYNYEIRLISSMGTEHSRGLGFCSNAMEAIENAIRNGALLVEPGIILSAIVIDQVTGFSTKFEVAQAT